MKYFRPASSELFFSRQDPNDPRLGDIIQRPQGELQVQKDHIYLAGYPDDEGIGLNGGRQGAKEAPNAIRQQLYRMTPSRLPSHLWDLGNLETTKDDLEFRHIHAQQLAQLVISAGGRWVGIGGGHDYGYPDGAAFLEANLNSKDPHKPLVVNFDTHLDVRPTDKGLSSGTAFYRLLQNYGDQFDFVELGAQCHCNSVEHINWCRKRGGKILFWEDIQSARSPTEVVKRFLENELLRLRPVFLSIDIDAFSSSYAMGCSQSWPTGWLPKDFFPLYHFLLSHWRVKALGIYEVSPKFDSDSRTARLAAQIIYHFLFHGTKPIP